MHKYCIYRIKHFGIVIDLMLQYRDILEPPGKLPKKAASNASTANSSQTHIPGMCGFFCVGFFKYGNIEIIT